MVGGIDEGHKTFKESPGNNQDNHNPNALNLEENRDNGMMQRN